MKWKNALLGLLIFVIFMSGCNKPEFNPSVKFELDRTSVIINDNSVSKEFVTATVTREDDENQETIFTIKFPDEKENVYATDWEGNRTREMSTKSLITKNAKDTLQFKVFGKKGEAAEATYILKVELWWNDKKIDDKDIMVTVR